MGFCGVSGINQTWCVCVFEGSERFLVQLWRWRTSRSLASQRAAQRGKSCWRFEANSHKHRLKRSLNMSYISAFSFQALDSLKGKTEEIPCVVGDEHVWTKDIRYQLSVSSVIWVNCCSMWRNFITDYYHYSNMHSEFSLWEEQLMRNTELNVVFQYFSFTVS